jgi:hypothetical protein
MNYFSVGGAICDGFSENLGLKAFSPLDFDLSLANSDVVPLSS